MPPRRTLPLALLMSSVWWSACSQDWSSRGNAGPDAEAASHEPDGGTNESYRAKNIPSLGSFGTRGAARSNGARVLSEDGFEVGAAVCTAEGRCATGSFTP